MRACRSPPTKKPPTKLEISLESLAAGLTWRPLVALVPLALRHRLSAVLLRAAVTHHCLRGAPQPAHSRNVPEQTHAFPQPHRHNTNPQSMRPNRATSLPQEALDRCVA